MIGEFHFLRPLWLLALLPLLALSWSWLRRPPTLDPWRGAVDDHLLSHLRSKGSGAGHGPVILLALAWAIGVLALAGPTWSRMPAAKFRPDAVPLVVVLDLSRSMDALDVKPSRLSVAQTAVDRYLEALEPREVGLVVFSGGAHAVMPLTEDKRLIRSLVPHMETGLMPRSGSSPAEGLRRARDLITQSGAKGGEVLLVTDGDQGLAATVDTAAELRRDGIRVSVLGIGTTQGGPVPTPAGAALTFDGEAVVPRLDPAGLRRVAEEGDGAVVVGATAAVEVTPLLPGSRLIGLGAAAPEKPGDDAEKRRRPWRDRGPWLLWPLLVLAALGFRRGWLGGLVLVAALGTATPAAAFDWEDLWRTPDQRALALLKDGHSGRAAALFRDPFWRGVAQYRDGDFAGAEATFERLDSASAHFNRGNALVHQERLEEALAAYAEALARDPGLEAARTNRRLIEDALAKQEEAPTLDRPPPAPGTAPPAPDAPDEDSPFVQEFLEEKGGDRLIRDIEGEDQEHDVEGTLGSGQILSEGKADAAGKEGEGTGQASRRAGFETDSSEGARRSGEDFGAVSPGQSDSEPGPAPAEGQDTATASPSEGETGESRGRAENPGGAGRTESQAAGGDNESDAERSRPDSPSGAAMDSDPADTAEDRESITASAPPPASAEERQARAQWLARIPDDPGGLLRELFRRQAERDKGEGPGGLPW